MHLAHTRTDSNPFIDSVAETVNYDQFDMLLLGGDLAVSSSKDSAAINYLDSIFDLGNVNTLWALGNHDIGNMNLVAAATDRDPYYIHHVGGATFIVLYTNDSLSYITQEQMELVNGVADTISNSSHLIVLHHKLLWMMGDPILEPQIGAVSNGPVGTCHYCLSENNFWSDVYPALAEVRSRGIEVWCIGGDLGNKVGSFSYETAEGIQLLGSGIDFRQEEKTVLHMILRPCFRDIRWFFRDLKEFGKSANRV